MLRRRPPSLSHPLPPANKKPQRPFGVGLALTVGLIVGLSVGGMQMRFIASDALERAAELLEASQQRSRSCHQALREKYELEEPADMLEL
jgi:hypothetical protein